MGVVADGEMLSRIGTTIVGTTALVGDQLLGVRNETGSTIPAGTLVAVTGFSVAEDRGLVSIADKDNPALRPAIGVTTASFPNNSNADVMVIGTLTGVNTSAFTINDQLVLGSTGAFSRPPPNADPFTGEIQLVGSITRVDATLGSIFVTLASGLLPMTAAHFFAARETSPSGGVTGGNVTRVTGLNVDVAAGSGFVNDNVDVFRVTWSAVTNLALAANDTSSIFVDKNGLVQASVSPPDLENNIVLADAITDGSSVLLLANHQVILPERPAKTHQYVRDVVGNIVVSGVITAKDAIALRLEVATGTFYIRDFRVTVPATDPITFTYWFRDGSGGFTRVAGSTLIDKDNFDDGSGTLAALVATEFKKDLLFVVPTASGTVEYHVFYGQEKFTSQSEAESGDLPAADGDVIINGVQSGGIVIEGASATIASVVDVRPFLGQLGPGTTAVTDHGLLSGLGDVDDHPGFAVLDGTRAFTGAQDLGGNAITNVGNVDGVDVSAHKARHVSGGADAFTATDLLEAVVKRFQITGPTTLTIGTVADGEFLKRVGTTLVGAAVGGSLNDAYNVGSVITVDAGAVEFESALTIGTIFDINYPAAKTLSGTITGVNIDVATNVTAGIRKVVGLELKVPVQSGATSTSRVIVTRSAMAAGRWIELNADPTTLAGPLTGIVVQMESNVTPGSNPVVGIDISLPASTSDGTRGLNIGTGQKAGKLLEAGYNLITTLSGAVVGMDLDLSSNVTAGSQTVEGIALTIPGSTSTNTRAIDIDSRQTAGTWIAGGVGAATTLTNTLTGIDLNLSSNITPSTFAVVGLSMILPATSSSGTVGLKIDTTQRRGFMIKATATGTNLTGASYVGISSAMGGITNPLSTAVAAFSASLPAATSLATAGYELLTKQKAGRCFHASFNAATVLTNDLVGLNLLLTTNVTAGAETVDGIIVNLPSDGAGIRRTLVADNAILFRNGDLVVGATTMSGTEKLRVVGDGRIEGNLVVTGTINVSALATWTANDAMFPAANPMAATSRGATAHALLAADDTTNENVIFEDVMTDDYGAGSIRVDIHWVAATATTGDVKWNVEFERIGTALDIDADSFAAAQTTTNTTNATSGIVTITTVTLTQAQADGIAAGEAFRLRLTRDAAAGGDTLVGDAQVLRVMVEQ